MYISKPLEGWSFSHGEPKHGELTGRHGEFLAFPIPGQGHLIQGPPLTPQVDLCSQARLTHVEYYLSNAQMLLKFRIMRKRTFKRMRKFGLWRATLTHFLIPGSLATGSPGELHTPILCCQDTRTDGLFHHARHSKPPRKGSCRLGRHLGLAVRLVCHVLKSSPPALSLLLVCLWSRQNPSKIGPPPEFLGRGIKHKQFPSSGSLKAVILLWLSQKWDGLTFASSLCFFKPRSVWNSHVCYGSTWRHCCDKWSLPQNGHCTFWNFPLIAPMKERDGLVMHRIIRGSH